jgi:two-component system NarL family sensor kinase
MKSIKDTRTRASIEAEEKERHRIAKDIHDSLGQQLSAIKLYLNALKKISPVADASKYKTILSKSVSALDEAAAELSDICFNLMPAALNAYGLIYAIGELTRKIKASKKIDIGMVVYPGFPALDKTLEINLFRVVQEFINNAIKHGKAKHVQIQLGYIPKRKQIELTLKDNGKGFNTTTIKPHAGMGLKNVRSRIDFHSGKLTIKSNPGKGTTYEIIIPIKNNV